MKLTPFCLVAILICATTSMHAQNTPASNATLAEKPAAATHKMNFVKFNITGILLKNYSLTYERILNKTISLSASYRIMPTGKLPFASSIAKSVEDDNQDAKDAIESLRIGNYAITPELRFYLGKGYGKGFYIALFYRYAKWKVNNIAVDYDDNNSLDLSGQLTSNTGGLMIGAQWFLGKHMNLDWWIFGPHYGSANGNFSGLSKQPLTPAQQAELRNNLEDIDIPLTNKTINVNASGATLILDGPWAGIRAGIQLGFRF